MVAISSQLTRRPHRTAARATALVEEMLALPRELRRATLRELTARDLAVLLGTAHRMHGTPYVLYRDDPVGFVEDVLGETLWSRQKDVLEAVVSAKRIAVPAGFGLGKTHLAARAVAHFVCTRAVGSAEAVTTATRMRQVQRQLWPHIRRLHARAGLPGTVDTVQWKMPDSNGVETVVAHGFTAPAGDEAAMQGIHSGSVLLIVDEAGGIDRLIGGSTNNLLTGDARMLAIGNPPSDDEGSWFEQLCADGEDPDRPDTVLIRIPATASPAITGEPAGRCTDHPEMPPHSLADHLPSQDWVDETIRTFGADSPYVIAKVHARFPRGGSARVMPMDWLEAAADNPDPAPDATWVRLDALGLTLERAPHTVARGAWIRLGVDVAADGGDEMVIARCVGDLVTVERISSGAGNASAMDVAGRVLEEIRRAELLAAVLGTVAPVRVKVDAIGVGWGVTSTLAAWGSEQLHSAEIVGVNVAENTGRTVDGVAMVPYRKRDEMWLAGRAVVQPAPGTGLPAIRLRVDEKTLAQLSWPAYATTSDGRTKIESKKLMRARGLNSPDRAEAVLLAVYEAKLKRKARLIV